MEPNKQVYVKDAPRLGDLFSFIWAYDHCPAVLVGFSKTGGWQLILLDRPSTKLLKYRKHGVMARHNKRLLRMDVNDLDPQQKAEYDSVINQLKQ